MAVTEFSPLGSQSDASGLSASSVDLAFDSMEDPVANFLPPVIEDAHLAFWSALLLADRSAEEDGPPVVVASQIGELVALMAE